MKSHEKQLLEEASYWTDEKQLVNEEKIGSLGGKAFEVEKSFELKNNPIVDSEIGQGRALITYTKRPSPGQIKKLEQKLGLDFSCTWTEPNGVVADFYSIAANYTPSYNKASIARAQAGR